MRYYASDSTLVGQYSVGVDEQAEENWQDLQLNTQAPEEGYAVVEVVAPSEGEVFVDDLAATVGPTLIVQENHYSPWGLNLAGIEKQGTPDHKYQYIGGEKQEEFGLQWYDLSARQYDPQLGRFFAIDPLADLYSDYSPYHYGYNSPLRFTDPSGMGPEDWYNGKGGVQYDPNVHSQADLDRMGIQGTYLGREGYGINEQTGQTVHYLPGGGTQEYTPMLGGATVVGQSDNSGLVDGIQMALDGVGMTEVPVLLQVAELISVGISSGKGGYCDVIHAPSSRQNKSCIWQSKAFFLFVRRFGSRKG